MSPPPLLPQQQVWVFFKERTVKLHQNLCQKNVHQRWGKGNPLSYPPPGQPYRLGPQYFFKSSLLIFFSGGKHCIRSHIRRLQASLMTLLRSQSTVYVSWLKLKLDPFSKVQHASSPIATVTCCLASSTAFITTLLWFLQIYYYPCQQPRVQHNFQCSSFGYKRACAQSLYMHMVTGFTYWYTADCY